VRTSNVQVQCLELSSDRSPLCNRLGENLHVAVIRNQVRVMHPQVRL
jgi:hypothetical protein